MNRLRDSNLGIYALKSVPRGSECEYSWLSIIIVKALWWQPYADHSIVKGKIHTVFENVFQLDLQILNPICRTLWISATQIMPFLITHIDWLRVSCAGNSLCVCVCVCVCVCAVVCERPLNKYFFMFSYGLLYLCPWNTACLNLIWVWWNIISYKLFCFRNQRLHRVAHNTTGFHGWRVSWWLWHHDGHAQEWRVDWGVEESGNTVSPPWQRRQQEITASVFEPYYCSGRNCSSLFWSVRSELVDHLKRIGKQVLLSFSKRRISSSIESKCSKVKTKLVK